jgi:hypothetical protein
MALFLSPFSENVSSQGPKISLAGPTHLKMPRIWTFAMLKDRPTLAENAHMTVCESCRSTFSAALGISSFGKGSKDQQPRAAEPPSSPGKDVPKAVA